MFHILHRDLRNRFPHVSSTLKNAGRKVGIPPEVNILAFLRLLVTVRALDDLDDGA